MSTKIALYVKVARRRIASGMAIEEVLAKWPKLTDEEKQEIRDNI